MKGQGDGSFAALTEAPGGRVSPEGADMIYSRYLYGAEAGAGGRTLEVGCGPGLGLGLLSASTSFVVGGDYDPVLLRQARATYGDRIRLMRLDVQRLPFADGSFDTVLFFEASYYVPDMDRAFDEITRVAARGGRLVFVNANPERPDFIPSPLSVHYHTAAEFHDALECRGFKVSVEGAFPLEDVALRSRFLVLARKLAHRFGFIPSTLAGRALIKRVLIGKMIPVPPEVRQGFGKTPSRFPVEGSGPVKAFKVLYVTAVGVGA